MAFEVTASKFRPKIFDELIGQEFVSTTLKNSILTNKFSNAYLLSGPRGCGKTSTARIISKSLNCINGPTITPCGICDNCVSIANTNNSDVLEIDGASNTSINDIRTIQEEILYPPSFSKFKIYIIDEVHMLSNNAFNALLKTIEEPPKNVIFIFATTEINKVPATIRSRCQQFNLRLIPTNLIFDSLCTILEKNKVSFEEKAIQWIAVEGKGSMRDSYTLLDQIISFCANEITLLKIQEKLGLPSQEKIQTLISSIVSQNLELLLREYFALIESGISPEQILSETIKLFKELLLKKVSIKTNKLFFFNNSSHFESLLSSFTLENIENIIEVLFTTFEKMRYSIDAQTEVEICLLKIFKYKYFIRTKDILTSLENIIDQIKNKELPQNNVQKNEEIYPQKSVSLNLEKSEILKELKKSIPPSYFQLLSSLNNILSFEESENSLTLSFSSQMHYDSACKYRDFLEKKFFEIIGRNYIINLVINQNTVKNKPKSIGELNSSRIIEVFDGEIY